MIGVNDDANRIKRLTIFNDETNFHSINEILILELKLVDELPYFEPIDYS